MKVSKVVMIVVALHVLVIGGIFVFEGCSRAKAPVPDIAQAGDEETANPTNSVAGATPDQSAPLTPTSPSAMAPAPAPAPTAAVTPPPAAPVHAARTYVVKKNDTLWKIAKAEHIKVGELARANNLTKTSALKVNQKLTIPVKEETASMQTAATTVGSAPAETAAPATAGGNVYVVKSGDSLWKIARAQNISMASLKKANNLTSDALKVNQKLTIPASATPAPASAAGTTGAQASASPGNYDAFEPGQHSENGQTIHVVDIGETPAAIARKYGIKVDDLMKANNITDGKRVTAGQKLVIPSAANAVAATPAMAAPIVTSNN